MMLRTRDLPKRAMPFGQRGPEELPEGAPRLDAAPISFLRNVTRLGSLFMDACNILRGPGRLRAGFPYPLVVYFILWEL